MIAAMGVSTWESIPDFQVGVSLTRLQSELCLIRLQSTSSFSGRCIVEYKLPWGRDWVRSLSCAMIQRGQAQFHSTIGFHLHIAGS